MHVLVHFSAFYKNIRDPSQYEVTICDWLYLDALFVKSHIIGCLKGVIVITCIPNGLKEWATQMSTAE